VATPFVDVDKVNDARFRRRDRVADRVAVNGERRPLGERLRERQVKDRLAILKRETRAAANDEK